MSFQRSYNFTINLKVLISRTRSITEEVQLEKGPEAADLFASAISETLTWVVNFNKIIKFQITIIRHH